MPKKPSTRSTIAHPFTVLQLGPITNLIGEDLTVVMNGALEWMLHHPQPDAVLSIESHFFNVLFSTHSCSFDLDIGKQLWLNVGRWSRLIKEYVIAEHVERFIRCSREIMSGHERAGATTNMLFKDPVRSEKKHRWGGCLMSVVFRLDKQGKPLLQMFSRTCYIGYMGFLDACIASLLASLITHGFPQHVRLEWFVSSVQLHGFKAIPYMWTVPKLLKVIATAAKDRQKYKTTQPTIFTVSKWYAMILRDYELHGVKMLDVEKYGPFKRVKRRWLENQGLIDTPIPPSLRLTDLTFEKAVRSE